LIGSFFEGILITKTSQRSNFSAAESLSLNYTWLFKNLNALAEQKQSGKTKIIK